MTKPLLSVIIPIYNAATTLDRCLVSILKQRMQDFEVLLIDDGSVDGSSSLCDTWAARDGRIVSLHQPNGGASSARNAGLEQAKGQWVCFIDADDCIDGDYFPEHFDDAIDMYLQNEWMGEKNLYQKLHVPNEGERLPITDFLKKYAHTNLFRGICSKFCKMSIIRQSFIRFDPTQRFQEDILFFMQYVSHVSFVQLLSGGHYIYYTDADWIQKYQFTRDEAYRFFETFISLYEQLPEPSPKLASNVYNTLEELANKGEKIPLSWKLHPSVLKIKRLQKPIRDWRYRIRCRLADCFGCFHMK